MTTPDHMQGGGYKQYGFIDPVPVFFNDKSAFFLFTIGRQNKIETN